MAAAAHPAASPLHPVRVLGPGEHGLDDLGRTLLDRHGEGPVPAPVEHQRTLRSALAHLADPADHHVVVAGRVDALDLAADPAQHAIDDRRASRVWYPADLREPLG